MKEEIFYAEVFESTRFKGTRLLEMYVFPTEKERDSFINSYNDEHLGLLDGAVPEVYTMAQTGSYYNILDYKRSQLQDETFSK